MLPCLLDWLHWTTSPFIHHTSLLLLWEIVCESVRDVFVSAYLWVSVSTHCFVYTRVGFWVDERVRVRRGVVGQLTSCANDHLAAESHDVLQHHTVLYCLCCHGDVVFSTIKCWYWLIVLASSGLFFYVHTHKHAHNANLFSISFTHTHAEILFYGFSVFMCSVYWSALGPIPSCRSPSYHKLKLV